jgi:hypothetical protein
MAQQVPVCMNDSMRAPIINQIKGTCLPVLMDQLQANITANKQVLARDVMFAALGTLERNLSVTQAENYINMVFSLQDPNTGELPWSLNPTAFSDPNADEFCTQVIGPILYLYGNELDADFKASLIPKIQAVYNAMKNRNIVISYTNIFLARAVNSILMGEAINDSAMASQGYAWLDQWIAYTCANGIHEFDAPTYYYVDLEYLRLGYLFAAASGAKAKFQNALNYYWQDITSNYFLGRQSLSGPHARDYNFLWGYGLTQWDMMLEGLAPQQSSCSPSAYPNSTIEFGTAAVQPITYGSPTSYHPACSLITSAGTAEKVISSTWDSPGTNRDRYNYVNNAGGYAVGSAPSDYDLVYQTTKSFNIELAGSPSQPEITVLSDSTDDSKTIYGQGSGGVDTNHHLPMRPTNVQSKGDMLALLDLNPSGISGGSSVLETNVILPTGATQIVLDGTTVSASAPFNLAASPKSVVGVLEGTSCAALRIYRADGVGGYAPTWVLQADSTSLTDGVARLTVYQYKGATKTFTETHAKVGVLFKVASCPTEADFTNLMQTVKDANTGETLNGNTWTTGVTSGETLLETQRDIGTGAINYRRVNGVDMTFDRLSVNGSLCGTDLCGASTADFSLSDTPGSQTVTAGAVTSYTTTVTPSGGFIGNVNLSVSGLPNGSSASFNAASVHGSGTSSLSVLTSGSTPTGSYPLTITGTSGSLRHSTTATLVVAPTPAQNFTVSSTPGSQTVTAGQTVIYSATVAPTSGFTGTVNFTASGLPAGATANFNPSSVTNSGTTVVSIATTAATPVGTYPLTITAASGSLAHSTTMVLVVSSAGDFAIDVSPTSQTVIAGRTVSYTTTLFSSGGFTGNVTLSISGLPSEATGIFSPTSIDGGSGTSTLNISTNPSTPAGSYILTVTGTDGTMTRSVSTTLNVNPFAPAGCLITGPTWVNNSIATQTGTFTATFDATPSALLMDSIIGFSQNAAAIPADMAVIVRFNNTGTIDAINGSGYAAVTSIPYSGSLLYHFRIVVDTSAHTYSAYVTSPGGTEETLATDYAFRTQQATASSLSWWNFYASTNWDTVCNFAIPSGYDFAISAWPISRTVVSGGGTSYTAALYPVDGFSDTVNLSVSGLPTGTTAILNPTSVAGSGSASLTTVTSSSTPAGTYTLTITGTGTNQSRSASTALVVNSNTGLPQGWTDLNIGTPGVAGSASYSSGTFTVSGGGSDIWGTSDQFNYLYEPLTGDVTLTAHITSQVSSDSWAKGGIMIRGGTAPNAPFVDVVLTPGRGYRMQYRTSTGASADQVGGASGPTAPYWVRLVRSGDSFAGYTSADGVTWIQIGTSSVTVPMGSGALQGLAVAAHNSSLLSTATFDSVTSQ